MLHLVPRSPGGSAVQPLPLELYAEGGFYFDLAISDELQGMPFEQYIERRLSLLNACYVVRVMDHGRSADYSPAAASEFWVEIPRTDGGYRIPASLLPDHVYSWSIIASVEEGGGSQLSIESEALYFHTSGRGCLLMDAERRDGSMLGYANALALLGRLQVDESLALRHSLGGVANYVNYPRATDSYVCTAIDPPASRPLPSPPTTGLLELPQLLELGVLMRDARELHQWISAGRDGLGQFRSLGSRCRLFAAAAQDQPGAPLQALASLSEVARRLGVEEALSGPEQLSLLSELLLLGDGLAATGSLRNPEHSLACCADYAASSERRLRQLSEMDPALYNLLGAERGRFWQEFFRSQRAELALLREEILSGQLSESGLRQRLESARQRAAMQLPALSDGMEERDQAAASGAAFAKLAPAGEQPQLRLLLEAQLDWIAAALWPRTD
ncbi:hypothetical protein KDL44_09315 [bacterium]|nr:hypothetical protein [bacterium]